MQNISPESPEARRKRLAKTRARLGKHYAKVKPGTRTFEVMKRVAVGVYSDGFIHAGNLAYLALLTVFIPPSVWPNSRATAAATITNGNTVSRARYARLPAWMKPSE